MYNTTLIPKWQKHKRIDIQGLNRCLGANSKKLVHQKIIALQISSSYFTKAVILKDRVIFQVKLGNHAPTYICPQDHMNTMPYLNKRKR